MITIILKSGKEIRTNVITCKDIDDAIDKWVTMHPNARSMQYQFKYGGEIVLMLDLAEIAAVTTDKLFDIHGEED